MPIHPIVILTNDVSPFPSNDLSQGIAGGLTAVGAGLVEGVQAAIVAPIQGGRRGGLTGFLEGMGRGEYEIGITKNSVSLKMVFAKGCD